MPLKAVADYMVSNVDKHSFEDEIPVRLCNYTDVYKNEFIHPGMDLMQATATEAEIEKFQLRVADVIITKDSESWDDIAIPALVTETADDMVCGYHLAMIRASDARLDGAFLFRILQSRDIRLPLELASTGVTRFGLGKEDIGKLDIPVPPIQVQRRIAEYLTTETKRIDEMVDEGKRLLSLLGKKRVAQICDAITRGINADAPLNPSVLPWLGSIPEHWVVMRLKYICKIGNGSTPTVDKVDYWAVDEVDGFPWLNSSVVNEAVVTQPSRFVTDLALSACHLPRIDAPAVLVGITGQGKTRGMAAVLGIDATINQHLAFLKPVDDEVDCHYLGLSLGVAYNYLRSESDGAGSTKGAITCEQLGNFRIPLPPRQEQLDIVAYLAAEKEKIEELENALQASIGLLIERRRALITSAVTGQLSDLL